MKSKFIYPILFVVIVVVLCNVTLLASSHREAPLIANDPLADNVDLYAFRSPDDPNTITIIATYVPMQLPHGGPNYFSFGENIRYEIHIDNDASIPGDEITYRFTFHKVNEDPTTFFNIRLGKQNLKTTYTLERSLDNGASWQTIINNGIVPPNNIGPRSIESAVGLNSSYNTLFNNAITTANTGEIVFAGPTDDPFFVDLGGIFDLGNAPRQVGNNVDGLACMNVSAIAIKVPINTLLKKGASAQPKNILDSDYVIGVWASASRKAITTLSATSDPTYDGEWIQVSRLGMPLTNEAVIPIGKKDYWNSLTPYEEFAESSLDEYFFNPELALYMDDDLFGGAVPSFAPLRIQKKSLGAFDFTNGADGLYGLKGNPALAGTALDDAVFGTLLLPGPGKPRSVDLWPAFHTGVPNVIPYQLATGKNGNPLAAGKPFVNNFLPNGGDMLRLNMAVPPTPRNDPNFSSLGLIQAAVLGLTAAPYNTNTDIEFIPNMDGFPNGRRLEDDVTRIELQAVGGAVLAAVGLWYDDYIPGNSSSPVTPQLLNVLGFTTGVEKNDKPFANSFPYLAQPSSGTGDCSGPIYVDNSNDAAEVGSVFASSNTTKKVDIIGVNSDRSFSQTSFVNKAKDADGIYYNDKSDMLIQLNRSNNRLDVYSSVLTNVRNGNPPVLSASSTSDFSNGREITVAGELIVVAEDASPANNNQNKLLVYKSNEDGIQLLSTYLVDFNVWGIQANVNTLYAVIDNSNQLAVFQNFFTRPAGPIVPDQIVQVMDLVRTHGLFYDYERDIMVLTDIGDAASATDGALIWISDFTSKINDNVVTRAEQIVVKGEGTLLGNPVDVAMDAKNSLLFVAERAGNNFLAFETPLVEGAQAPLKTLPVPGISAVYLTGSTRDEYPITSVVDINGGGKLQISVFPNPTSEYVEISIDGQPLDHEGSTLEVYDISGKFMLRQKAENGYARIPVGNLNPGVYILYLYNQKYRHATKFTKQ